MTQVAQVTDTAINAAIAISETELRALAESKAANEIAFLQAIEIMKGAEDKAAKAVTPTMRLALLRSRSEKLDNGMPAFTPTTFKAAMATAYGFIVTPKGKASKTLPETPNKHCKQFNSVYEIMFHPSYVDTVNAFIDYKGEDCQSASFSSLLKAIAEISAKDAADSAAKAGITPAPAPAPSPAPAPAPAPAPMAEASLAELAEALTLALGKASLDEIAKAETPLNAAIKAITAAWDDLTAHLAEPAKKAA